MILSRRKFLNLCKSSSVAIGLSTLDVISIGELLADPNAPTVLWLQGSGCSGCSVSFLNYIAPSAPATAAEVLISKVNLAFHQTVMDVSGLSAVNTLDSVYAKGNYILVVEGGVPTAFNGYTCVVWTKNGRDVTFKEAVTTLALRASKILCIGTCASWGGVSAALPNPSGVVGVKAITGKTTVNIAGCPPHPDWIVWGIAKALLNSVGTLDSFGRPKGLSNRTVHDVCPRRGGGEAHSYGLDGYCLKELGCSGPECRAACPSIGWNNDTNWCVDANTLCIGCTESKFPFERMRRPVEREGD